MPAAMQTLEKDTVRASQTLFQQSYSNIVSLHAEHFLFVIVVSTNIMQARLEKRFRSATLFW